LKKKALGIVCILFNNPTNDLNIMDTTDATDETSKKNEREEDSFSDDDVAVHSVRFKRKRIDGAGGPGNAGGASVNGGATGKGSGLYLDTIRRYMLDFDFEKVCSVSLSNLNVYACLVCGKYFQGIDTLTSKDEDSSTCNESQRDI